MKKRFFAGIVSSCALLINSSCATTAYVGDKFAASDNVEVFYAAKDVRKDYKVIGHVYASIDLSTEKVKNDIIKKAKAVGADGVIILGIGSAGTGTTQQAVQQADAIKYVEK